MFLTGPLPPQSPPAPPFSTTSTTTPKHQQVVAIGHSAPSTLPPPRFPPSIREHSRCRVTSGLCTTPPIWPLAALVSSCWFMVMIRACRQPADLFIMFISRHAHTCSAAWRHVLNTLYGLYVFIGGIPPPTLSSNRSAYQ